MRRAFQSALAARLAEDVMFVVDGIAVSWPDVGFQVETAPDGNPALCRILVYTRPGDRPVGVDVEAGTIRRDVWNAIYAVLHDAFPPEPTPEPVWVDPDVIPFAAPT